MTQLRRALTKRPGSVSQNSEHWPGATQALVSRFSGQCPELNQAASCCWIGDFQQLSKTQTKSTRQVWLQLLQRHGNFIFEKWRKKKEFKPKLSHLRSGSPLGYRTGWGSITRSFLGHHTGAANSNSLFVSSLRFAFNKSFSFKINRSSAVFTHA